MSKAASVIEINGVRYDAGTGKALSKVKNFAKRSLGSSNQVIDGFVRQRNTPIEKVEPKKSSSVNHSQVSRSKKPSAKNIHNRLERSHTLVRTVVAKPTIKVRSATLSIATPLVRESMNKVDHLREMRAKTVPKHSKVSRYGTPRPRSSEADAAAVGEIVNRQSYSSNPKSAHSKTTSTVMPSLVASASHQHLERLLDAALISASSHKQTMKKHRSTKLGRFFYMPKWLKISLALIIVAAAILLFAWMRVPAVAVKVASAQANIQASSPSYSPTGFSYAGPAESTNKTVEITYKNKISNTNYVITQKKSNLDSPALASTLDNKKDQALSTQVNGNTVYIYGSDNNATWINNNVLFTIENKASLSSDELLKIAGSMQ